MKTKLLFFGLFLLIFVSGNVQSQSQLWALTHDGGAYGSGAILQANNDGSGATVAFSFNPPDGYHPYGDLLQASDGNLYGTCFDGGAFFSCTVFRYEPATGTYTDVYDFDITHGDFPRSGVIEGPNGKLYGAASSGGFNGGGVIYSYDMTTGIYTDLYDLDYTTGGATPYGNPILYNGKLYGMTTGGGANLAGVIYCYDIATGTYSDVFDFGTVNGSVPYGSLMLASNGKFYGMTTGDGLYGDGVIFSFEPATSVFTKLYDFNGTDGGFPQGNLMQASNGLLYGMTSLGGASGVGNIFSYDIASNMLTNLYSFNGTDGKTPLGSLNQSGNLLCGTTFAGGSNNLGVIFNFDLSTNVYTKVLDFNGTNGSSPSGGGFITVTTTGICVAPPPLDEFMVYPNPVSDVLNVFNPGQQNERTTLTLTDVSGKIIFSSSVILDDHVQEKIDLSALNKGTYLLEIKSAKSKLVKKILKT